MAILLPQNFQVVQLMSGCKKSHAANRNAVFIGIALAHPSLLRQVFKKCDGGLANHTEFVDKTFQRALVESTGSHVVILFKARQHARIIARDMMRAVSENALGINDVTQKLLDRPLAGSVRELGGAAFIELFNSAMLCSSCVARIDRIWSPATRLT